VNIIGLSTDEAAQFPEILGLSGQQANAIETKTTRTWRP
jgi:hypothetical protein